MKKKNLPKPNVTYLHVGTYHDVEDSDLKGMICNPIYAGVMPFPQIVSDEAWVQAATQLIQDEGAEQFLVNMLYTLRQSMKDYISQQITQPQPQSKEDEPDLLNLEGYLYCSHDDLPMIKLGDEYLCIGEYLFTHLESSPVIDVVTEPVFSLVFQNGHTLPLLCPECGESLHIADEDGFLDTLNNLMLVDLGWDDSNQCVILEFGQPSMALELEEDDELYAEEVESYTTIEVHLDSIRGITCPYLH